MGMLITSQSSKSDEIDPDNTWKKDPRENNRWIDANGNIRRDDTDGSRWFDAQGLLHRDNNEPACVRNDGGKYWYRHGILHRDDGPAVVMKSGKKEWYQNGELHREDGPAIECPSGTQVWFLNGERQKELYIGPGKQKTWKDGKGSIHRDDGPAIEFEDGSQEWYQHGRKHRIGAPASISADGVEAWFNDGELSRIGGPAIEGSSSGRKEWWIDGVPFRSANDYWTYLIKQIDLDKKSLAEIVTTLEAYNLLTKHPLEIPGINTIIGNIQERVWKNEVSDIDIPYLRRLPLTWLTQIELPNDIIVKLNDQAQELGKAGKIKKIFHTQRMKRMAEEAQPTDTKQPSESIKRLINDGAIWENSSGQFHRLDGPAVEYRDGLKEWWVNGKRHRDDGPAIEFHSGDKEWWTNGVEIKKCYRSGNAIIWEDANNNRHRDDGPAVEYDDGHYEWHQHGVLHRDDGPAVEYPNGQEEWYRNGKLHREDGPAYVCPNGYEAWYNNDQCHRIGGPAITYPNGIAGTERGDFYINGVKFNDDDKYWGEVEKRLGFTPKNLKTPWLCERLPNPFKNVVDTLQKHKIFNNLNITSSFAKTILQTMQDIIDANKCSLDEIRSIPHEWLTNLRLSPDMVAELNAPVATKPMHKFFSVISANHKVDPDNKETTKQVDSNGNITYRKNGVLHRDDGPAVEKPNIAEEWFRDGLRHREDGPAVEWQSGTKEWFRDGLRHREDGPAIEYPNRLPEWNIHGFRFTKEDYWEALLKDEKWHDKTIAGIIETLKKHNYFKYYPEPTSPLSWKILQIINRDMIQNATSEDITSFKQLPHDWLLSMDLTPDIIQTLNTPPAAKPMRKFFSVANTNDGETVKDVDPIGNVTYRKNGVFHRDDGPAVELYDGSQQEWYLYGKRHRVGAPAVTTNYGYEQWWENDRRHRMDGPAIIYPGGQKEWWRYGSRHRNDGPAVEYHDGHQEWYLDGEQLSRNSYWNYIIQEIVPKAKSLEEIINMLYKHNFFKYNPDASAIGCAHGVLDELLRYPVTSHEDINAIKKMPYEWITKLNLTAEDITAINQKDTKPVRKFFSVSQPILQSP